LQAFNPAEFAAQKVVLLATDIDISPLISVLATASVSTSHLLLLLSLNPLSHVPQTCAWWLAQEAPVAGEPLSQTQTFAGQDAAS